jgi:DNA-directed RNA polymerase specialized sigma24 family protein
LRKASVREHNERARLAGQPATGNRSDPEAELITKSTVWQALDVLAPRRRAIVVMVELEGLSVAAIAALLGISKITVRWHLSMGKRELATILKAQMGDGNGT